MKTLIKSICVVVVMVSCGNPSDSVKPFIPGTYVRFSSHDMGVENDTLIIEPMNEENSFQITRKWRYDRTIDGVKYPSTYQKQNWSGIYDNEKKAIIENTRDKIITFAPDKGKLYVNTTEYSKIKSS